MCFDRIARAFGNYYLGINKDENYTCYKHGNTCGSIRPSQSIVGHKFGGLAKSCAKHLFVISVCIATKKFVEPSDLGSFQFVVKFILHSSS